jgi:hypothetical protein
MNHARFVWHLSKKIILSSESKPPSGGRLCYPLAQPSSHTIVLMSYKLQLKTIKDPRENGKQNIPWYNHKYDKIFRCLILLSITNTPTDIHDTACRKPDGVPLRCFLNHDERESSRVDTEDSPQMLLKHLQIPYKTECFDKHKLRFDLSRLLE